MSGLQARNAFDEVAVSIPTGPATDISEGAEFVLLSLGLVEVSDAYEVTLTLPTGNETKRPLGQLLRASALIGDVDGLTLDVKMEGVMKSIALYRFKFQRQGETARFASIAEAAEQHESDVRKQAEQEKAVALSNLEKAIRKNLSGRRPVVHRGAQLYGPSDGEEMSESEVLLGEGAVVFLDPASDLGDNQVGVYELLFYSDEDGSDTPIKKLALDPKMKLARLGTDDPEIDDDDDSAPNVSFQLSMKGGDGIGHTFVFENFARADAFERDFRVRHRVMQLAIMVSKRQQGLTDAQGQLEKLKKRGMFAQLWRRLQFILVLPTLLFFGAAVHPSTRGVASIACSNTCQLLGSTVDSVPMRDLQQCFKAEGMSATMDCIEKFVLH